VAGGGRHRQPDSTMTGAESRTNSPEPRSQDSRDEILNAATRLFANRGFHETSMSEVARSARVSKALIFWHFKTKEELFFAVLNRLLEPYFIDFAEEAGALDEKSQILKLVESYLLFVRDNASSIRFFCGSVASQSKLVRKSDGPGARALRRLPGAVGGPYRASTGKGAL